MGALCRSAKESFSLPGLEEVPVVSDEVLGVVAGLAGFAGSVVEE